MSALSCYIAGRTLKVLGLHHCEIDPQFERPYLQLRSKSLEYAKTVNHFPLFIKRDSAEGVRRDCIERFSLCESKGELYFFAFKLAQLYRNNKELCKKVLVMFMVFFSNN